MRTLKDRIRHTLLFEAIAIGLVVAAGSWALDRPAHVMGALSMMFGVLAMSWNLLFNWMFDLWDRKYRGSAHRGFTVRAVHAVLFELVIVIAGVFLVSWWLDISYWDAFIIDLGFSIFFLVYAYCYNWTYDQVFPVPAQA